MGAVAQNEINRLATSSKTRENWKFWRKNGKFETCASVRTKTGHSNWSGYDCQLGYRLVELKSRINRTKNYKKSSKKAAYYFCKLGKLSTVHVMPLTECESRSRRFSVFFSCNKKLQKN